MFIQLLEILLAVPTVQAGITLYCFYLFDRMLLNLFVLICKAIKNWIFPVFQYIEKIFIYIYARYSEKFHYFFSACFTSLFEFQLCFALIVCILFGCIVRLIYFTGYLLVYIFWYLILAILILFQFINLFLE